MQTSIKLQSLTFDDLRTYLATIVFILGNLIMPQLFHMVPQGGITWLPIYFFTLVGACILGWRVGLLTALASPLINALLFGMPAVAALPAILMKSVFLALIAGFMVNKFCKVTVSLLTAVVLGYQILGTLGEWILKADFVLACQDFRIGIPGMLLQIIGGYLLINALIKK